jgi:hypothetical protein
LQPEDGGFGFRAYVSELPSRIGEPEPLRQIDFITVVQEADCLHWLLQARSIAKYAAAGHIRSITIVANDPDGNASYDYVMANLEAYGAFAACVTIYKAADLMKAPERMDGWRSQQVLKLLGGAASGGDWLVWLDGKNHFLLDFGFDAFFTEDGRARTIYMAKKRRHDRRWLAHSLDYFGVSKAWLGKPGPLT